jgi:hypothetical protein
VVAGPSGLPLRGDVELHVRSSLFRAHGHATDPAYADIVLHIVFEDDTGEDTLLPGGRTAPVVALAPWVARRAGELRRWLEQPLLWREPCHDAATRMGADGVAAALEAEGERRFDARVARAAEAVRAGGLDQALYEGILEAAGYGGNGPQMLALARLLPWAALCAARQAAANRQQGGAAAGTDTHSPQLLDRAASTLGVGAPGGAGAVSPQLLYEALLLGAAGLLPSQRGHRGPVEPHVETLELVHARCGTDAPLPPGTWKLWGVRPANMPARRIATAAALLASLGSPSALRFVLDARSVREALQPFAQAPAAFWSRHYDPCAGPCALPPAVIGRARALEILVNAVLPAAAASGDPAVAARARALYARLPRPSAYGATRSLERAIASEGVRIPLDARRSQGLLALHRDWCTQGGCGRCPLSDRHMEARDWELGRAQLAPATGPPRRA